MRTWVIVAGFVALAAGSAAGQKPTLRQPQPRMAEGQPTPLRFTPDGPVGDLGKAEQAAVNKVIVGRLVGAAHKATELYNANDPAGSYMMYDITLRELVFFLQDPPLKARVQFALDRGVMEPDWARGAVVLRTALNDVRNRLDRVGDRERSLFDRLGGRTAVVGAVKLAYENASKDPAVNLTRGGEYPYTADRAQRMQRATVDLIQLLSDLPGRPPQAADAPADPVRQQLDEELRGRLQADLKAVEERLKEKEPDDPARKTEYWKKQAAAQADKGKLTKLLTDLRQTQAPPAGGTVAEMVRAHRGMRITDEEYDAALKHLRYALAAYAVPDKEVDELAAAVEALRKDIVYDYRAGGR